MTAPTTNDFLRGFYGIMELLHGLRDADEDKIWIRITDKLAAVLDAEAATYFVVGAKSRQLIARYSLGVEPDRLSAVPIEVGKGLCGWVAKHGEPLLVEDAYADSRFLAEVDRVTGFKTKSVLCLPLFDRLDLSGVLEFINKRGGAFQKEDFEFAEAICRAASMALKTLRMEAALHKVTAYNASILENLTGGFLAVDMRGKVMICNPAAKRILELHEDILNMSVDNALRHIYPMAEILVKTLATRQVVKRQELAWNYENQARVLGYSTLLIQDPRGNPTGAGITFQDLTHLQR